MFAIAVERLLAPIRVGIRSRLLICLIAIASAYSSYFTSNPYIRLASLIACLVAAELMIMLWGRFFLNNFVQVFAWKKAISWEEATLWEETSVFAKFRKIALEKGVKLHSKKPFGIQKNLDNAYANFITRQIVFGDRLIKRLPEDELLALFGHELTHLKEGHNVKLAIWASVIPMLVPIPLLFTLAPSVVLNTVSAAAFFMTFLFVSWRNEYCADRGGAAVAGSRAMSSLLKHLVPRKQRKRESETHPSVSSRLLKLSKSQL